MDFPVKPGNDRLSKQTKRMGTKMAGAKRPLGILIVAGLLLLLMFPALVMAVLAGISGPPDRTIFERMSRSFFLINPILLASSGIGLLMLKKWARYLTLTISAFFAIFSLVGFTAVFWSNKVDGTGILILISIFMPFVAIIFYLTRSSVKERFN